MILVILLVYAHFPPPRTVSFILLYAAVSFWENIMVVGAALLEGDWAIYKGLTLFLADH